MIPQEYIQEVVRRTDIVELVRSYVQLRHRGRTHTGLCPFHNEKTPSFVVYPENQSFYCFGCGVGGDAITFEKKISNLDYVEAVKSLAARAGMPMPEEDDQAGRMRSRVLNVNRDSARFFYAQMAAPTPEGRRALAYWRGRGLSDSTIRRFGLGYAPDSFSALRDHLRRLGYEDEELLEAGVIRRSAKGNLFDTFRNRVMTPIFDLRGNIIAFGGRVMGDEKPKYVNTPETIVYKKSKAMFALSVAKKSKSRRYILCEGYMDVISLHQAGFDTAVAACGTALTAEQVKLLTEYADEVVLCYDTDEAGRKATARSLELFSQSPIRVSVLNLPGAKDPDEFIKRFGKERFEALLNGTSNAIEYKLARIREKHDVATPAGRLDYIKEAIQLLAGRITPTERDVYTGRLAEETGVSRAAIEAQLKSAVTQAERKARRERQQQLMQQGVASQIKVPYTLGGSEALGVANAEQQLVCALIKRPELVARVKQRIQPSGFLMEDMRNAYEAICSCQARGVTPELGVLSSLLSEQDIATLSQLLARNYDVPLSDEDVELYVDRMERSLPKSRQAGKMTAEELDAYLESLRRKKGAGE